MNVQERSHTSYSRAACWSLTLYVPQCQWEISWDLTYTNINNMNDATAMAKQVESNPKQREINGRIGRKFYQLLIKGSLLIFNPLCATTRIYHPSFACFLNVPWKRRWGRKRKDRAGPRKPKGKEDSIGQISSFSFSFPLLVIEDKSIWAYTNISS
jgi:hypothetical protein